MRYDDDNLKGVGESMKGGRVIRVAYPAICVVCGKVVRRRAQVVWDGEATCMKCARSVRGVAPLTDEEIDEMDQPVKDGYA